MMTPSRLLASAALLAATCCPYPVKAFVPMRRAAPNHVVDRGSIDDNPRRRADIMEAVAFRTARPLPNGGARDARGMAPLARAPFAGGAVEGSRRGGVCPPLRLFDVFHMVLEVGGVLLNSKLERCTGMQYVLLVLFL